VDPARRGQGIGARLLDSVIALAGERPVSLTTRIDNPAQHLYVRHGFHVVEEKRHAAYEARTGSPGRVLMVRPAPLQLHA
jgi:ribosomal protein S18 acetylase RimI-like enzyme